MTEDIDIVAYALRKAIHDQKTAAEWRKREGNTDAELGCEMRLTRLRKALARVDQLGAVGPAE